MQTLKWKLKVCDMPTIHRWATKQRQLNSTIPGKATSPNRIPEKTQRSPAPSKQTKHLTSTTRQTQNGEIKQHPSHHKGRNEKFSWRAAWERGRRSSRRPPRVCSGVVDGAHKEAPRLARSRLDTRRSAGGSLGGHVFLSLRTPLLHTGRRMTAFHAESFKAYEKKSFIVGRVKGENDIKWAFKNNIREDMQLASLGRATQRRTKAAARGPRHNYRDHTSK